MQSSRVIWAFLLWAGLFSVQAQSAEWKIFLDSAGMKVFLLEDVSNHELSCKVITELPCAVSEAMTFFQTFENYAKWITGCESATTIRQKRENNLYGRLVYKPGFGTESDKREDAVIRILIHKAGESRIGNFSAVPDEIPVEEGFVRQTYFNANWALVSRDAGKCVFTYTVKIVSDALVGSLENQRFIHDNYTSVLTLRELFAAH